VTTKNYMVGLIFLCAFLLFSCGYRFAGSGGFPDGVDQIFIEVFDNRTSQTGIERIFTNQLVIEFTRQRESSLAGSPSEADAILKGIIQSVNTKTISRVKTEVANQREVVMTVDLELVKKTGGEVIWAAVGFQDREAYDVADGKIITNQNENEAIGRLSERLSERIFSRLTDDF